jgi:hypothetical protein
MLRRNIVASRPVCLRYLTPPFTLASSEDCKTARFDPRSKKQYGARIICTIAIVGEKPRLVWHSRVLNLQSPPGLHYELLYSPLNHFVFQLSNRYS